MWRAVQIALGAALLALLWHAADGAAALRLLARADPVWLVAALAALTLQTLLSALRWRLTAARLGARIGLGRAIGEYYLGQAVNQSLPGGVLGDAGRALRSRGPAGLIRAGQAVMLERLSGQMALIAVTAVAVLATALTPGGIDWPRGLAATVVLASLGMAAVLAALPLAARLPGALGRGLAGALAAARTALFAADVLPRQIALSLGTVACNLAAFAFCARATGTALPLGAVTVLIPLVLFAMVVPLSVGGWGPREGAAVALFPLAGATATEGLAASVAFGLVLVASVLPGLIPLALGRRHGEGLARRPVRPRLGRRRRRGT